MEKGLDIVNGLTDVYFNQNLEKKNHLAAMTIDFIDKLLLVEFFPYLSQYSYYNRNNPDGFLVKRNI